jgi:hypothetical protein
VSPRRNTAGNRPPATGNQNQPENRRPWIYQHRPDGQAGD